MDSEILELAEKLDTEIKQLKHTIYKICWYMRGGVSSSDLLDDTDFNDLEILQRIIEENIESAKKTGMPLI